MKTIVSGTPRSWRDGSRSRRLRSWRATCRRPRGAARAARSSPRRPCSTPERRLSSEFTWAWVRPVRAGASSASDGRVLVAQACASPPGAPAPGVPASPPPDERWQRREGQLEAVDRDVVFLLPPLQVVVRRLVDASVATAEIARRRATSVTRNRGVRSPVRTSTFGARRPHADGASDGVALPQRAAWQAQARVIGDEQPRALPRHAAGPAHETDRRPAGRRARLRSSSHRHRPRRRGMSTPSETIRTATSHGSDPGRKGSAMPAEACGSSDVTSAPSCRSSRAGARRCRVHAPGRSRSRARPRSAARANLGQSRMRSSQHRREPLTLE